MAAVPQLSAVATAPCRPCRHRPRPRANEGRNEARPPVPCLLSITNHQGPSLPAARATGDMHDDAGDHTDPNQPQAIGEPSHRPIEDRHQQQRDGWQHAGNGRRQSQLIRQEHRTPNRQRAGNATIGKQHHHRRPDRVSPSQSGPLIRVTDAHALGWPDRTPIAITASEALDRTDHVRRNCSPKMPH